MCMNELFMLNLQTTHFSLSGQLIGSRVHQLERGGTCFHFYFPYETKNETSSRQDQKEFNSELKKSRSEVGTLQVCPE